MKRVIHVMDSLGFGGIQSFVMNVYRHIDRSQIQFDFLIHHHLEENFEDEVKRMGGKVYCLPSRRDGFFQNKIALKKFFDEHQEYDAVHMHESSLSYIEPLLAAKRAGVRKRIIHSHSTTQKGNPLHRLFHKMNQKRIYSIVTDVYACSDKAAEWLCGRENFLLGKYKFIPNSINPTAFYYNEEFRNEIRGKFCLEDEEIVVGLIGRLTWQKNHKFLLEVFAQLKKMNEIPLKLMIVGGGDLMDELKHMTNELGIQNETIFTGLRTDAKKFYSAMDILIMPSVNEGFPVTLVEAQAASLPCLVSQNVTQMAKISDFVLYESLDSSTDKWAKLAMDLFKSHDRKCEKQLFNNSLFNIECSIEQLVKGYE